MKQLYNFILVLALVSQCVMGMETTVQEKEPMFTLKNSKQNASVEILLDKANQSPVIKNITSGPFTKKYEMKIKGADQQDLENLAKIINRIDNPSLDAIENLSIEKSVNLVNNLDFLGLYHTYPTTENLLNDLIGKQIDSMQTSEYASLSYLNSEKIAQKISLTLMKQYTIDSRLLGPYSEQLTSKTKTLTELKVCKHQYLLYFDNTNNIKVYIGDDQGFNRQSVALYPIFCLIKRINPITEKQETIKIPLPKARMHAFGDYNQPSQIFNNVQANSNNSFFILDIATFFEHHPTRLPLFLINAQDKQYIRLDDYTACCFGPENIIYLANAEGKIYSANLNDLNTKEEIDALNNKIIDISYNTTTKTIVAITIDAQEKDSTIFIKKNNMAFEQFKIQPNIEGLDVYPEGYRLKKISKCEKAIKKTEKIIFNNDQTIALLHSYSGEILYNLTTKSIISLSEHIFKQSSWSCNDQLLTTKWSQLRLSNNSSSTNMHFFMPTTANSWLTNIPEQPIVLSSDGTQCIYEPDQWTLLSNNINSKHRIIIDDIIKKAIHFLSPQYENKIKQLIVVALLHRIMKNQYTTIRLDQTESEVYNQYFPQEIITALKASHTIQTASPNISRLQSYTLTLKRIFSHTLDNLYHYRWVGVGVGGLFATAILYKYIKNNLGNLPPFPPYGSHLPRYQRLLLFPTLFFPPNNQ